MASQPETKKPSAASRYLFLFLIGLVVGAICTVMAMRALQARQDPFPDSVMQVMQKQAGLLKQNGEESRCAVTDNLPRLQSLRAIFCRSASQRIHAEQHHRAELQVVAEPAVAHGQNPRWMRARLRVGRGPR